MLLVADAADQARARLAETLDLWFPRCVSPEGGFHQAFARDWSPLPEATRFQVFQSRMGWVAAVAAECFPERREEFGNYVRHGAQMLGRMTHSQDNLCSLWWADLEGNPFGEGALEGRSYGVAFQVFALAAAARAFPSFDYAAMAGLEKGRLGDFKDASFPGWYESIPLAAVSYRWSEEANGGRRAWVRERWPEESAFPGEESKEKVFNTHLHIFEALLELRKAVCSAADDAWLEEIVSILNDIMWTPSGRMLARFDRAWNPISDVWEIGHDLEAAYLLLESSLGDPTKALKTIDYALERGFDHALGGFFHEGDARGEITDDGKVWWTQDEGLNALIEAWKATGEDRYEEALLKQWAWIRDRQWDAEYGGVFARLSRDGAPEGDLDKASPWKAAYHDVRALRNLSQIGQLTAAARGTEK